MKKFDEIDKLGGRRKEKEGRRNESVCVSNDKGMSSEPEFARFESWQICFDL
jgi:hypothetical protein